MVANIKRLTVVSAASALVLFEVLMELLETLPKGTNENSYLIEK
tara:strand:+ start:586 stop:717 length:132 start_codon:yes stop_codon:yes gene_type:complete